MTIPKRKRLRSPVAVLKELHKQAREAGITQADIERAIAEHRTRASLPRR